MASIFSFLFKLHFSYLTNAARIELVSLITAREDVSCDDAALSVNASLSPPKYDYHSGESRNPGNWLYMVREIQTLSFFCSPNLSKSLFRQE